MGHFTVAVAVYMQTVYFSTSVHVIPVAACQIRPSPPSSVISRPTCFHSSLRCCWQVGSAPIVRRRCDCLASSAPFTNIQTYLLTYLLFNEEHAGDCWCETGYTPDAFPVTISLKALKGGCMSATPERNLSKSIVDI